MLYRNRLYFARNGDRVGVAMISVDLDGSWGRIGGELAETARLDN